MDNEHWFYCGTCETHTPSTPSRLSKRDADDSYQELYEPHMRWLLRSRKCLICGTRSFTGEINAEFLEEIFRLQILSSHHEKWTQERISEVVKLQGKVSEMKFIIDYDIPRLKEQLVERDKEIEKLKESITRLEGLTSALPRHIFDVYCNEKLISLWRLAPWLKEGSAISRSLSDDFVKATAWWLTHSSGWPVRAPKHSERIYKHPHHGWSLDFGANTFLVEQMLLRSRSAINNFAKNSDGDFEGLKNKLTQAMSGAVANYDGKEYTVYYPITNGRLEFGAQAIDVQDGISFLLRVARLTASE